MLLHHPFDEKLNINTIHACIRKLLEEEYVKVAYIDYSGKVYINYPSENKIKDVKDNKEYEYEGEFLQTYSEGIVTKDKNKVIKKILGK